MLKPEPIAIVGIGCRFPGASGALELWRLLRDGVDAVELLPNDRWDLDAHYDPDPDAPNKMYTRHGGSLQNIAGVDWRALEIRPREALALDPQHRLLMEVTWEAFEDAGVPLASLAGARGAVCVGLVHDDYAKRLIKGGFQQDSYSVMGNTFHYAANRLSHFFDLHGPSMAIDTGCSSALTAIHLVRQSLQSGESDIGVAGGVLLILSPETNIGLSRARFFASDGKCRPCDANAGGLVRSDGAGVVILKRLSDALAAGDRIYAVIRGSASSHAGKMDRMGLPGKDAQVALVREACRQADVAPSSIGYVELHSVGSDRVDWIEAAALNTALAAADRSAEQPLLVGSIKGNIGHCEAASGIAAVMKVALGMTHRQVPRTLNVTTTHPRIAAEASNIAVASIASAWPSINGVPSCALVRSVGFGGAATDVVMEPAPASSSQAVTAAEALLLDFESSVHVLPLSARSSASLVALIAAFQRFFEKGGGANTTEALADICFTAAVRRTHHPFRKAVVVSPPRTTMLEALERLAAAEKTSFSRPSTTPATVAFRRDDGLVVRVATMTDAAQIVTDDAAGGDWSTLLTGSGNANQQTAPDGALMVSVSPERDARARAIALLYDHGADLDWARVYRAGRCVSLPAYPWERERFFFDNTSTSTSNGTPKATHPSEAEKRTQRPTDVGAARRSARALSGAERHQWVLGRVKTHVAEVCRLEASDVHSDRSLPYLGLDSIMAAELARRLSSDFVARVPITSLFTATLSTMADELANQVDATDEGGGESATTTTNALDASLDSLDAAAILARVDQLSEDEVDDLLWRVLQ